MTMGEFTLRGRRVGVVGWGRSGRAAAGLAKRLGAIVFVSESRPISAFDSGELAALGDCASEFGGHTERLLASDLVVLSPGVRPDRGVIAEFQGPIWGEIELAYRVLTCPIVAVTGSNGKSTTASLIYSILRDCYTSGETRLLGNIGEPVCDHVTELAETDICLLEVSSFQMETIHEFHPRVAVWLNLVPNHLDRYANIEAYASAKERVFGRMGRGDLAVVGVDDSFGATIAGRLTAPKVITVSAFEGEPVSPALLGAVKSPVNLRAAITVCEYFGIGRGEAMEAAGRFRGLPHRVENLGEVAGVTFYNDSKATNVAAVNSAIASIAPPITLIIGGKDKGEDYSKLDLAKCPKVIAYGAAADRISESVSCEVVREFDRAVDRAFRVSSPGAAVLLSPACSSYDSFRSFEERGDRFRQLFESLRAGLCPAVGASRDGFAS